MLSIFLAGTFSSFISQAEVVEETSKQRNIPENTENTYQNSYVNNEDATTQQATTYAWYTEVAKQALIKGLRYGGPALSKLLGKLSPNAEKYVKKFSNGIANFLENLTNWQEGPIITGLVGIGVPADVAAEIAKYIVLVIGI